MAGGGYQRKGFRNILQPFLREPQPTWSYEDATRRFISPLNALGLALCPSEDGRILVLDEDGGNEKSNPEYFPKNPLVVHDMNLGSRVPGDGAYMFHRERFYVLLEDGRLIAIDPKERFQWREITDFTTGQLSTPSYLLCIEDRFIATTRLGEVFLADESGKFKQIFTLAEIRDTGGTLVSSPPPLLKPVAGSPSIFLAVTVRLGRTLKYRGLLLRVTPENESVEILREEPEEIRCLLSHEDNIFLVLSSSVIRHSLGAAPDERRFQLRSKTVAPGSFSGGDHRLLIPTEDGISSLNLTLDVEAKLTGTSGRSARSAPLVLHSDDQDERGSFFASDRALRAESGWLSKPIVDNPSSYLSYANGKIFVANKGGLVCAFQVA